MNTRQLANRTRLATALQVALLLIVFQGVVATTPSTPLRIDAAVESSPAQLLGSIPLNQPVR